MYTQFECYIRKSTLTQIILTCILWIVNLCRKGEPVGQKTWRSPLILLRQPSMPSTDQFFYNALQILNDFNLPFISTQIENVSELLRGQTIDTRFFVSLYHTPLAIFLRPILLSQHCSLSLSDFISQTLFFSKKSIVVLSFRHIITSQAILIVIRPT